MRTSDCSRLIVSVAVCIVTAAALSEFPRDVIWSERFVIMVSPSHQPAGARDLLIEIAEHQLGRRLDGVAPKDAADAPAVTVLDGAHQISPRAGMPVAYSICSSHVPGIASACGSISSCS